MNQYRFLFFFFIIFSYYNEIKLAGIINIINETAKNKYVKIKRKFAFLYSETESEPDTVAKKNKTECVKQLVYLIKITILLKTYYVRQLDY